jgi:hypothetical protein
MSDVLLGTDLWVLRARPTAAGRRDSAIKKRTEFLKIEKDLLWGNFPEWCFSRQ